MNNRYVIRMVRAPGVPESDLEGWAGSRGKVAKYSNVYAPTAAEAVEKVRIHISDKSGIPLEVVRNMIIPAGISLSPTQLVDEVGNAKTVAPQLWADSKALGEDNDCSVFALAAVLGVTYGVAHGALELAGRTFRDGIYSARSYPKAAEILGYTAKHVACKRTLGTFPMQPQDIILECPGHVFACLYRPNAGEKSPWQFVDTRFKRMSRLRIVGFWTFQPKDTNAS